MSVQLLSSEPHNARKVHKCIWCAEPIAPGERYVKQRLVVDGDMQANKWHSECLDAANDELGQDGEWEFEAYDNPRPSSSQPGSPKS